MKILFEDENIIVCIKVRGILSQADSNGIENMVSILEEHSRGKIYPIHRLDREVGGVMVYAKTKKSAANLSAQIIDNRLIKEYVALVYGKPSEDSGIMEDLLFKDSKRNKSYVVKRERRGVKKANLEYSIIESDEKTSRVKIRLHTGRTHQIRVQFASRKMPLLGDRKYGAGDDIKFIHLWSYRLSFFHPISGENLTFEYEPDF